jgi:cellulose synthase/poly-beta-1,6-N-acetylglucosamine synthase-like glycosyltransferase
VSLHVPAYNEPPEMVKETLSALSRIDYPNFEVVMVDDNTKDETLWRPVEEHCRSLGFKFCHLDDWPGYKSGALNFALKQTDPDAEIIGVIDSDYMVEPGYLRDLVGLFRNRDVAFVQTPQDYRDFDTADVYAKACYDAYRYFFRISMAARNEHNGIIFAGTMGLIRRDVLERMGGWDEWCITEDAELSIRILHEGHRGLYVDRTYGRGLMPLDYEGLKKQRFRWAFGGMQILRMHWRKMLPRWRGKRPKSGLSWAQQAAYLNGALQWLNDPLTLVFTAILFIGVGAFATGGSLVIQPMVGSVIFVPFTFLLFSLLRFLWALRVRLSCSWRDAYRALTILLGLIWVVSLACVQGLTRRQGVFLRTPKKREGAGMASSLSIVRWETILAALCIGGIGVLLVEDLPRATRFLLMGLMTWQFMIYSAAPLSLLWSRQSANAMAGRPRHVGYRTVGHLIGNFVGESRTTLKIAACVLVAVLLFWLAATNLTERERILSMTDDHAYLSRSFKLIRNPSPIEIKALIHDEGRSALSGQVDQAVSLWTRDGFIHDMNFTPANPLDDRFWNGIDDIRRRYREEFAQRTYRRLEHKNISVRIDGDRARAENDLYALIETPRGMETVILRRSDQWTFKREEGDWKIESLTLNTVPR